MFDKIFKWIGTPIIALLVILNLIVATVVMLILALAKLINLIFIVKIMAKLYVGCCEIYLWLVADYDLGDIKDRLKEVEEDWIDIINTL